MLFNKNRRNGDIGEALVILFLIVLVFILPIGIGIYDHYCESQTKADAAVAKAVQREQDKVFAEKMRNERNTMTGVVREVDFSPADHVRERTKIIFEDGRGKTFKGLSTKPIKPGDTVTIVFDGNDQLVTVDVK